MSLLPCQLQPEQLSALCNTVPGTYPAQAIMSGRMAIDTLIVPIAAELPPTVTFDPAGCTVSYGVQRPGGRREIISHPCPLGSPGT